MSEGVDTRVARVNVEAHKVIDLERRKAKRSPAKSGKAVKNDGETRHKKSEQESNVVAPPVLEVPMSTDNNNNNNNTVEAKKSMSKLTTAAYIADAAFAAADRVIEVVAQVTPPAAIGATVTRKATVAIAARLGQEIAPRSVRIASGIGALTAVIAVGFIRNKASEIIRASGGVPAYERHIIAEYREIAEKAGLPAASIEADIAAAAQG